MGEALARHPAYWLGDTLGGITDRVENALRLWPEEHRDQLYDTAWLAFLMAQHENAWNMQALEGDDPNVKPTGDPEEFTIVEGLQVRNALVWLAASVWATWAADSAAAGRASSTTGRCSPRSAALPPEIGLDPRHWDGDPNPTLVLYNPDALVVIDRNGGRVTHAFVLRDGVPRTVSGTFKSYQYRDRPTSSATATCCRTPCGRPTTATSAPTSACSASAAWTGRTRARRTRTARRTAPVTRVVPDNFNAYTCGVAGTACAAPTTAAGRPRARPGRADRPVAARRPARRAGTTDRMTWHEDTTFAKTFTLDGTTLRVDYTGVAPGHVVDNELCVDLWAGAQEGRLLTRAADAERGHGHDERRVGAARLTIGRGLRADRREPGRDGRRRPRRRGSPPSSSRCTGC